MTRFKKQGAIAYKPHFAYTARLVAALSRIDLARGMLEVAYLPPDLTYKLQLAAQLGSTHHSTAIEGNQLDPAAIRAAIASSERRGTQAQQEVRNYWLALDKLADWVAAGRPITEELVQELHAIVDVRGAGRRGSRTPYRPGECPVVDTGTRAIVYGPPEPGDVPDLMTELVAWLSSAAAAELHPVLRAAIVLHRFLSIHPFPDGNGRTGRLLSTWTLWRSGYRMQGFLSFDEYFNRDRDRYYREIQMGLPVDYYSGRHDPDLTPWLIYFAEVVAAAAEEITHVVRENARVAQVPPWIDLSRPQQQTLNRVVTRLLAGQDRESAFILKPADLEAWIGISDRTAREWLGQWAEDGFVEPVISGQGERVRRYVLTHTWQNVVAQLHSYVENSGSNSPTRGP